MTIECNGIAGYQPYEFTRCEENPATDDDGLEEEPEARERGFEVVGFRLLHQRSIGSILAKIRDEVPGNGSTNECEGSNNEGAVVAKLRNEN